jgi:hypothetical protein
MAITPGRPVPEHVARNGIGAVFGLCAAIAVIAFFPGQWLLAVVAGVIAAVAGWTSGALPYRLTAKDQPPTRVVE